jgi:cytochrome c-type biogenesis protein CcmE
VSAIAARALNRLLTNPVVVVGILAGAAALMIHGSFRSSTRVATVSELLRHPSLWGSRVRLAGLVRRGSVESRANGLRFVVGDPNGHGRITVDYSGETSDALRGGRAIDVTGTFDGHGFEAEPDSLVVLCGRTDSDQHC